SWFIPAIRKRPCGYHLKPYSALMSYSTVPSTHAVPTDAIIQPLPIDVVGDGPLTLHDCLLRLFDLQQRPR
ncbi:hypothetical protein PENTCL1PPCAC_9959, partial [Pristionchus entomophagus]